MRNLKKILALVLALVMSLSLMSVAGATEFPDSDQISETYAESVDVLTGLKVFQGNKGEFKPKDNITRAEVANIIYRIVTGDVDGTSVGIYADYNKFTDVPNTAWFAGCVNYCANAEYIKGRGNGKFDPYGNVTGYEALAMILRAIGYDKNGEFTGANWQVQTAATARNRGITKNIVEGTLGVAASREMVAEILCQTILVPVADYSLAFGYRTTDAVTGKENETLAKKTFKMEKLEGVVTANEYASLTATSPLAAGQTTIGDKTMNVTSTLDDLGESRYVYVIPQTGTTRYDLVSSKVYDTGKNNVYDSGDEVKTVKDETGKDNGITSLVGAKHLRNYGELTKDTSDWRIEYVISLDISEYEAKSMFYENGTQTNSSLKDLLNAANNDRPDGTMTRPTAAQYAARDNSTANGGWARTIAGTPYTYEYRKVITVGETITPTDVANIRAIFYASEHIVGGSNPYDIGEVYVGTSSKQDTDDISNKISYQQFVDTYLKDTDVTISTNGLGNRLKIVDNNNDGVAEYVLQTVYTIGMISAVDAEGKLTLDITNATFSNPECHAATRHVSDAVNYVTSSNKVVNDGEGDLAVGDVVIYAVIDGNARVEKAAGETAKINTVNRTALTATTVDGNEYKESNVHEHSTALNHGVDGLVGNTSYNLYFDKYGNLAAYTEGTNGDFVLITDGWFDSRKGGDEYAVRAYIDGSIQTVDVTANGNLFIDGRLADGSINKNSNDWGMLRQFAGLNVDGAANDKVRTTVAQLQDGMLIPVDKSYLYSRQVDMLEIENNTIPGRDFNKDGQGLVHSTNYLDGVAYKDTSDVTAYDVRALSTTTYYFVYNYYNNGNAYNTVVRSYTGYGSVPTVNKNDIEDVYAVGTRATTAAGIRYYTADIVVVEMNSNYQMVDSEQVFIPEFPVVTSNVQYEQVEMIRGNGERETLTVDLYKSILRPYDEADGTTGGALDRWNVRAGLYFLDESDTEKDVYIIKYMSRDQIRASGKYAVGFVKMNTATGAEDWTSIDLFVRDSATNQGAQWNKDGIAQEIAKKNVTSSKYYTLAYDQNNGNAKLGNSDRITALAQNTDLDVRLDTEDTWYNETERGENNIQRNEVLVAYSGANIVYAISFNEYASKSPLSRDYAAQNVWFRCMPNDYYGTPAADPGKVNFYGATDEDGDKAITVDWAAAIANQATPLTVPTGMSYGITPNLAPNNVVATTYTLTLSNGDVYYLTVNPADRVTDLHFEGILGIAAAATYTSTNTTIQYPGSATTLAQIQGLYNKVSTSTYTTETWKFFDANGKEITDTNTTIGTGYYAQVTITPQDTTVDPVTYTIALSGEDDRDAADRKVAQDTFDGHNYTLWSDGTNVYESETEALAGAAATGKYSWTVAGFSLPSVVAGLVNRDLTGTGYTSAVQANGAVPAFPTADNAGQVARGTYDVDVKLAGDVSTTYVTKDGSVTVELHFVNKDAREAKTVIEETVGTVQLYLTNNNDATEQPRYYISKTHAAAWDGTAGTDFWQGNADTAALTNVINPALETAGVSNANGTGVAVIPGSFGSRTETTRGTNANGNTVITYTVPVAIIDRSTATSPTPTDTGVHATVTYSVTYINFAE